MRFLKTLLEKFTGKPVDWDELEESLIRADLGVPMTIRIIEALHNREGYQTITAKDISEVTREEIARILPTTAAPITPFAGKPTVLLIVGVNGTGKTTSCAKLAHYLKSKRPSVLLAAADTFRAAAIEQLGVWAQRIGVEMIKGPYNADPAALCYQACEAAARQQIDFLICDTAGRLHTRSNLMGELNKVKRSIAKQDSDAPHETFLVVDATTGSNALAQAREFHQAIGLTGLIVTKLDGTAKGGVAFSVNQELNVPIWYIGTGEKLHDFAPFDRDDFIAQMI